LKYSLAASLYTFVASSSELNIPTERLKDPNNTNNLKTTISSEELASGRDWVKEMEVLEEKIRLKNENK
jgi:hypothetical protein